MIGKIEYRREGNFSDPENKITGFLEGLYNPDGRFLFFGITPSEKEGIVAVLTLSNMPPLQVIEVLEVLLVDARKVVARDN